MLRTAAAILLVLCLAACGSKKAAPPAPSATTAATTTAPATSTPATTAATSAAPGALQVEVAATAAGDIPDNQVFVDYPGKSFTMKFPEGWAQSGAGEHVTFRDKNNIVRIVIGAGPAATPAEAQKQVASLRNVKVTGAPKTLTIGGRPAVKLSYETTSAPNAVTGKRVTLTVDRYVIARGGKRAVIDLGSPQGVDNVDAYRLMIQSFRLR